jgi:hypothetical protein
MLGFVSEFRTFARLVKDLKMYAGTGKLTVRFNSKKAYLYYRLGNLIFAEYEDKINAQALPVILGWHEGLLIFEPAIPHPEQAFLLTPEQEAVFESGLRLLQKQTILDKVSTETNQNSLPLIEEFDSSKLVPTDNPNTTTANPVEAVSFDIVVPDIALKDDNLQGSEVKPVVLQPEFVFKPGDNQITIREDKHADVAPVEPFFSEQPVLTTFVPTFQNPLQKFQLQLEVLPPLISIELDNDANLQAILQSDNLNIDQLLNYIALNYQSGVLEIESEESGNPAYARVFFGKGELLEVSFDNGNSIHRQKVALNFLRSLHPTLKTQIKFGGVDPNLIQVYFTLLNNGRSLYKGISIQDLDLEKQMRELARTEFSGMVKLYNKQKIIYYFFNKGKGLGAYLETGVKLQPVKLSLEALLKEPQIMIDIITAPSRQPLTRLEAVTLKV